MTEDSSEALQFSLPSSLCGDFEGVTDGARFAGVTNVLRVAPGGVLSGGEQQMLCMCRTLMGDPDMIMIDEPTEGLAPKVVEQVGNLLKEIANRGVAILLIEQKLSIALRISHRVYVMGHGSIVYEGTPESLMTADDVRSEWLEV